MIPYFLIFALLICAYPILKINKKVYLFINLLAVWVLMSFRGFTVGNDTFTYIQLYPTLAQQNLPRNFLNWLFPLHAQRIEAGYILYDKILYHISHNPRLLLIVSSFVMVVCLAIFLIKLDLDYYIGLLIFDGFGFLSFYLSGLRQAIAISLCMLAFIFALKRKFILFVFLVWLAALFHVTAWIFIITYLFINKRYQKNKMIMWIICFIVLIIFIRFENVANIFSNMSNEFSNYDLNSISNANNGILSNLLSIMLILITLFFNSKAMNMISMNENTEKIAEYMLIFSILCYMIALRMTQLSRLSLFFNIGYFPILSNIKNYYRKRATIIITISIIVYFIFIQLVRPEWNNIIPYRWME